MLLGRHHCTGSRRYYYVFGPGPAAEVATPVALQGVAGVT
jgi:hypothetical protein